ncbi:MAG: glycosyltransferase family 2 protein [Prevotellaceae bacterium]|nr:glycosyltransferase family 2 protein [Prevotellaceae bacterium]
MISIIIPSYNRAHLIKRALKSVTSQTYDDIEIIVVDDASTDNTAEVVKTLNVPNLNYIKLPKNEGACHARNVGIEHAKGEYISFLDSDDTWECEKLEKQYKFLLKNNANVVVCNYWKEKDGKKKKKVPDGHDIIIKKEELLNANIITTGAILISKEALVSVGAFDESMPRYQDWELVLRIIKKYDIFYLDKPLLTLFFQKNSITNSTSMEKKFFALDKMVQKNKKEMLAYPKAYAHHCWSMGLYSLYMNEKRWNLLSKGCLADGFNLRRICIYILLKCGFVNLFKSVYSRNH